MIADFVEDYPALAAFTAVLVLLLIVMGIVLRVWFRRRRAEARRRLPPRAPRPDPAPLPALSLDNFAPLPPRTARPTTKPQLRPVAPSVPASVPVIAPVNMPVRMPVSVPVSMPVSAPVNMPVSLLAVDDSAVARVLLRKLFEAAGHRVDVAADGDEALALLESKSYAVLVTDLEMPKVNGFELIAAVQSNPASSDLPIIAITGHDELSARVHDMKGLYGIFKKPWNETELLQRVTNLARLRRLAANG